MVIDEAIPNRHRLQTCLNHTQNRSLMLRSSNTILSSANAKRTIVYFWFFEQPRSKKMIRPSKHVSIIQPYSIAGAPLPPGLRPPIQMERQTPHMIRFSRGHEVGSVHTQRQSTRADRKRIRHPLGARHKHSRSPFLYFRPFSNSDGYPQCLSPRIDGLRRI